MDPQLEAAWQRVLGALPPERLHDAGNIKQVLLSYEAVKDVEIRRITDLLEAAYKTRDFNQGDPPAFQHWAGRAFGLTEALAIIAKTPR